MENRAKSGQISNQKGINKNDKKRKYLEALGGSAGQGARWRGVPYFPPFYQFSKNPEPRSQNPEHRAQITALTPRGRRRAEALWRISKNTSWVPRVIFLTAFPRSALVVPGPALVAPEPALVAPVLTLVAQEPAVVELEPALAPPVPATPTLSRSEQASEWANGVNEYLTMKLQPRSTILDGSQEPVIVPNDGL